MEFLGFEIPCPQLAETLPLTASGETGPFNYCSRRIEMFVLDFNQCRPIQVTKAGMETAAEALLKNDPHCPRSCPSLAIVPSDSRESIPDFRRIDLILAGRAQVMVVKANTENAVGAERNSIIGRGGEEVPVFRRSGYVR